MIRTALTAFSFGLLLLELSPVVVARDLFVDNVAGDDRRDASSPEISGSSAGPVRSLRRALQLAESRDRIIVANTGQPYRESITIQAGKHSGSVDQPFEIVGNGAILDGTEPVPQTRWEHVQDDVYRFQPPRTSFQMLFLGQRPAIRKPLDEKRLPKLEPLEWCLYDRHIYFRAEENKLPIDYELSYAHLTVGMTVYETRHIVIRDFIVQGYQLDGINAHDNVFDGMLRDLNCRGNGRSGISIGGACRIRVQDCLAGDNGAAQLRIEGRCKTELIRCELLDNTAPGLVREGGEVFTAVEAPGRVP